ncbi:hypothetical protein A6S26_06725 [Nostoc sp. ATCC 43529]|nr:hypothetical protein A6S26_06725 [Nostoc sp. ATCC 43529]
MPLSLQERGFETPIPYKGMQGAFIQAEKNYYRVSKPLPPWGREMEVREKTWTQKEKSTLMYYSFFI